MQTPEPFGDYVLLERVAMGGMAELFLAQPIAGQDFGVSELCIKRILPHYSDEESFINMFIDEATIAAKLNHSNIVRIFEFNVYDGQYFIAMELIRGKDLKQTLELAYQKRTRFTDAMVAFIVRAVVGALHYAHTRIVDGKPMGIVHRDVSPHNVLLGYNGDVKLTDFGIAKAASRITHTRAGTVKGKCAYMSPEQARGKTLDGRSDMFSAGILMHEMLTGQRLFTGDSDFDILTKVLKEPVPLPSSMVGGIDPFLEKVCLRALDRDRDKRFKDCGEMEHALDTWLKSKGFHAGNIGIDRFVQTIYGMANHPLPALEAAAPGPVAEVADQPTQMFALDASQQQALNSAAPPAGGDATALFNAVGDAPPSPGFGGPPAGGDATALFNAIDDAPPGPGFGGPQMAPPGPVSQNFPAQGYPPGPVSQNFPAQGYPGGHVSQGAPALNRPPSGGYPQQAHGVPAGPPSQNFPAAQISGPHPQHTPGRPRMSGPHTAQPGPMPPPAEPAKGKGLMGIAIALLIVSIVGLGAVAGVAAYFLSDDDPTPPATAANTPNTDKPEDDGRAKPDDGDKGGADDAKKDDGDDPKAGASAAKTDGDAKDGAKDDAKPDDAKDDTPKDDAKTVTLHIESDPAGATVFVGDAKQEGVTPLDVKDVKPGDTLKLKLTLDGHDDYTTDFALEADDASPKITVNLTPTESDTKDDGTDDGTDDGKDDGTDDAAAAKTDDTKPDDAKKEKLDPAKAAELAEKRRLKMEELRRKREGNKGTGTVSINAVPWAEVYLDGRRIGRTPIVGYTVSAGSHSVLLKNSDMRAKYRKKVSVQKGKTAKVFYNFNR